MSTSAAIAAPVPAGGAMASGMALDERVGGGEGVLPPSLQPDAAAAADAAVDDEPSPQHAGAVAPQEATTVKVHMAAEEEANETNGTAATDAAAVSEPNKRLTDAGASSAAAPRYKVPAGVPQYSEVSPEVRASWLGLLFFSWLDPVVIKGAKTALEQEDMYAVRPDVEAAYCSELFAREWEVELERAKADPTKEYVPSVTMAMYRIFKVPFWVGGGCKAVIDGLQFLQPILLEWILEFMAKSQIDRPGFEKPPAWEGYVLAVAIGVNPLITTILSNLYFTVMMTIGLRSRTILTTHLYKKSLKLSPAARQAMSVGQIVNMMSTDTAKVDLFCGYMHFIWSGMEQVAVAIALLIRAIGPPALAGLGVVIIMIPFQGMVIRHLQQLRKATVKYTDRRVKLMNEILQGIRVIKVYAWEDSFLQKMISIRAEEMRFVQSSAYTRAWNSTLMQTGPLLMSLLAFITLGLTTDNLEAQYIFSSLTLFNLLRMPLMLLPMTIAFGSDAKIGIQRIQAFLLADELHSEPEYVDTDKFAVKVSDANFEWEKAVAEVNTVGESMKDAAGGATSAKAAAPVPAIAEAKEQEAGTVAVVAKDAAAADPASGPFHLDGVSFEVPKGSLTVIVGAVGSGKSSLLAGILGEMKRASGSVQIAGSVGYCPQQAWIQNATLKQNVLFGLPFDQEKYDEAIRTCALEADIAVLPAGDATEIGEKGINLSGGQKQRVNLARAVYFDADIIMLDDPLSAVDAHVSKYLFNNCICTKLRQKTRILVTHQLQYVSSCDQVLFVEHGRITEQGTYTQLMRNKGRFFTLMSTYVGEESDDEGEEGEAEGEAEEGEEGQQASLLEVPSPSAGNDDPSPSAGLARSADNALSSLATAAGSVAPARPERQSKKRRNRGLKTAKSSAHADKAKALLRSGKSDAADPEAKKKELAAATQLMQAEERTKGGVPWSVYLYYVSHCGGWILVLVSLIFMCLQTAASTWTTWWLGLWSNDEYDRGNNWYLGIYAGIGLSQCVFALVGTIVSAYMGVIAAVELHTLSFWSVLRAPMAFFDTTPIGRIINRFSKDQDVIDSLLMDTLRMIVFMSLNVLATFIMIIVVTPFFAIPLVPILIVYYFVQKSYRNTSRELKRLESISRSPLFAHFSESLTGLATIRAYRAQKSFIRANEVRMDDNNRSYYLLVLTQRWLSIRVETIGAFIAFFAALIIVIQRDSLSAGNSGVSLSYAIGITSLLNWVVRQTVEAENSMNSVERSKFYTDSIAQEAAAHVPVVDDLVAKQNWPQRGEIQFEDLQIRYRDGLPLVLHGISLNIKGGERVGIVGRTGAGKSSLMVALFRIVEAAGGSIKIDGQDISALGLNALRSKLAIIPQDPVLYSGTVRSNLDPFDQYTDAQLWDVLEKSYLKATIAALDLKLQAPISEGGENMSVGERCQLCLARAMLRNAKVLIMDEATASVDMQTDAFIQNSLRKHFNCTLLTIAHRLNTICDYDRVLVLSFGRVQEYDSPANLLRDPNSAFSSMVNETGEVNAALLRNIAFKAEQGIRIGAEDLLGLEGAEAAAVAASADAAAAAAPGATKAASLPSGPVGLTGGSEDAAAAAAVDTSQVRWLDDDGAADDAEVQL